MAESIISPGVFSRENDISFIQPQPVAAGAAFLGPTVKGPYDQPTIVTSYNEYVRKFGDTFLSSSKSYEFLTSIAVKNYFSNGGQTALVTRIVSGAYTPAINTYISASTGKGGQPFQLKTLGTGVTYNNATASLAGLAGNITGYLNSDGSLVSGSKENVRWEVTNVNTGSGTFTLLVRQGNDSTNNKTILETFNVDLDPNSANYIERVVGNQYIVNNRVIGEYPNRSNYLRVSEVTYPTPNYLKTDGLSVDVDSTNISYSASLPSPASGSFWSGSGDIKAGATFFGNITATSTNIQGLVGDNYSTAITILSNQDDFQFNIISAPGLLSTNGSSYAGATAVLDGLVSLAETRGDCIAIVDLVQTGSTAGAAVDAAKGFNSSYAATYWPWVQVQSATGKNEYVPAGTMIPGVFAFTDASSAPWFAPAGLVRGGIGGVIQAEKRLTKLERDTLYSGKVNPIASFPGTGISVFGQKTLQTKASALDRVNVRRLLIELKKFIGDQARNLVFEQNTIATRNKFLATVNPYLESVVQRQGLYAYRVVMDDTNNTADVVDRNQLIGQIFIQPAKTIEFVVLDFVIEPTGATFG
jgi:uncharacterized protein